MEREDVSDRICRFIRDVDEGLGSFGIFLDDHPWVGPCILLVVLAVIL